MQTGRLGIHSYERTRFTYKISMLVDHITIVGCLAFIVHLLYVGKKKEPLGLEFDAGKKFVVVVFFVIWWE